jgi:NO-binding membrane sensor protein with MHYT domain
MLFLSFNVLTPNLFVWIFPMTPWFLDAARDLTTALHHTHDPKLVLASVIIACIASYGALSTAGRIATTGKRGWLLCGALAMGAGVWTMHFIAMLAFKLPVQVTYDFTLTFLSTIPAILASGLMLSLISRPHVEFWRLVIGGTLMGAGIGIMHYAGMAAMRMDALMLFDPAIFGVSVLVAVVLAIAALYISSSVRKQGGTPLLNWRKLAGALFMGCAVAGMHYTGMSAAHFFPGAGAQISHTGLDPQVIGTLAGVYTLLITGLMIFMALVDSRFEKADQTHRFLQEVSSAVSQSKTANAALQTAIHQVCLHAHWPVGHAYLIDGENANGLVSAKLWHTNDHARFAAFRQETENLTILPGLDLAGQVLAAKMPVLITNIAKAPNFPRAQLAGELGLKSCFAFPVLVGNEVGGVLEFFSSSHKEPDPALLEAVARIGGEVGRVLELQRSLEMIEWKHRVLR